MELGLAGQHVLITGSAGGIGLVVAQQFLQQKCHVTLHYHKQSETLQSLIQQFPSSTFAVSADSKDENSVIEAFRKATEKFGPINILIANHAIFPSQNVAISEMSLSQWNSTLEVNLTGVFLFVREYLRQLKSTLEGKSFQEKLNFPASVVIVGSTAGKFGEAFHSDYAASKSALMYGFLRSLKNEIVDIAPRGRANCVAPGWVGTPMAAESVERGEHFKALQTTPLKKIASTGEVANAILFLSSSASGHTTGGIIEVDGGMEGRVLNSLADLQKNQ